MKALSLILFLTLQGCASSPEPGPRHTVFITLYSYRW